MNSRPELKIDWATHEAAKYAVEHWHYSGSLSSGRNVYIGAWEDEKFVGVIVFGIGSGNATNGKSYGLARSHEMAELKRDKQAIGSYQEHSGGAAPTVTLQTKRPKQAMTGSQPEQREGSAHPDAPNIKGGE